MNRCWSRSCRETARRVEVEFLSEMKGLGGKLFVSCDKAGASSRPPSDYLFEVGSGCRIRPFDPADPADSLPGLLQVACRRSQPAEPVNLSYWVETTRLYGDIDEDSSSALRPVARSWATRRSRAEAARRF